MKLPHPVILLIAFVAVCAVLTWILPAGEYDRRDDPATGRSVVVAGTYHRVDPAPVGPFGAAVAIPRGFVEAADVIGVVLFVGAAWIVVDRVGTLGRLIAALVGAFGSRGLIAIPVVSLFFATMGAVGIRDQGSGFQNPGQKVPPGTSPSSSSPSRPSPRTSTVPLRSGGVSTSSRVDFSSQGASQGCLAASASRGQRPRFSRGCRGCFRPRS